MGTTSPWTLRYPEGSDPVRLSQYFRNLAEDTNAALDDVAAAVPGGSTIVAKRVALNVVPASGGQVAVTFSGFASPPVVSATMEDPNNFNLLCAGVSTSSANFFVYAAANNAPAADGYGVRLHVVLVGPATPGQTPAITSPAAP